MIEIRWHARAGQGAKTASQLYAVAMLRAGKSVQAFPEYGPERRGAPVRAFTRVDDRPIRRHDSIEEPDIVVVLDPSLARDGSAAQGLAPDGLLLVNGVASEDDRATSVPAESLAAAVGSGFVNLVMVGALAGRLGAPPLDHVVAAAVDVLGTKIPDAQIEAAVTSGYEETSCPN
jgi:pyruvate ferredoxin oxidoreductase gamma subunit